MNEAEKQGNTREISSPQSWLFEKENKTERGAQGRALVHADIWPQSRGPKGTE